MHYLIDKIEAIKDKNPSAITLKDIRDLDRETKWWERNDKRHGFYAYEPSSNQLHCPHTDIRRR